MYVTITFHQNDDLTPENRERVEGSVLTLAEAANATWTEAQRNTVLGYYTNKSAALVIVAWESEGFEISEFEEISFSNR
jgi:hypothetical protein